MLRRCSDGFITVTNGASRASLWELQVHRHAWGVVQIRDLLRRTHDLVLSAVLGGIITWRLSEALFILGVYIDERIGETHQFVLVNMVQVALCCLPKKAEGIKLLRHH